MDLLSVPIRINQDKCFKNSTPEVNGVLNLCDATPVQKLKKKTKQINKNKNKNYLSIYLSIYLSMLMFILFNYYHSFYQYRSSFYLCLIRLFDYVSIYLFKYIIQQFFSVNLGIKTVSNSSKTIRNLIDNKNNNIHIDSRGRVRWWNFL